MSMLEEGCSSHAARESALPCCDDVPATIMLDPAYAGTLPLCSLPLRTAMLMMMMAFATTCTRTCVRLPLIAALRGAEDHQKHNHRP